MAEVLPVKLLLTMVNTESFWLIAPPASPAVLSLKLTPVRVTVGVAPKETPPPSPELPTDELQSASPEQLTVPAGPPLPVWLPLKTLLLTVKVPVLKIAAPCPPSPPLVKQNPEEQVMSPAVPPVP